MLAVMATSCLHKVSHMFVISNNTWHQSGILGKKGGRWAHTSWAGKEKEEWKDKDDKTDPIFIKRTLTAGLCVLLGSQLVKETYFSFLDFSLPRCLPNCLVRKLER